MRDTTADKIPLSQRLLAEYLADPSLEIDQYDDLVTGEGQFRARWKPLIEEFDDIGLAGLKERSREAQERLYENGVTFNVYEDDVRKWRSWQLDPIPYVISPQTWSRLEAGLEQRARLLEALVDDLYGEQTVIKTGVLPPELVYTHAGWLFPAADTGRVSTRPRVLFQGMDVVRDHQGDWRVLADWTQAPSGAGYALENRVILSRALSRLYRDAPLSRLASFLQAYHRCLSELAPHHREDPNIVLLTPGPGSSSYFEHAWLANYMNFSLVEGGDLVVRDGQVSIRTLGGLKAVDVIVRQVLDDWCDPLELRGDSLLGVPGLMQAARRGEVAIANSIGVGILEYPALAAFLPELCRTLLGEPLLLPGQDRLWCGKREHLNAVLSDLSAWRIRDTQDIQTKINPNQQSDDEQARLRQLLVEAPHRFVAERPLLPATSPSYNLKENRVSPRPVCLRFFALADPEERRPEQPAPKHRIMPGGLAWVAEPGTPAMESQIVKDVWVLSPVAQPHISLLQQSRGPILATRDGKDLPSRVAESLYWIGRYGERLDNRSRLMRETLTTLGEDGQTALDQTLLPDLFDALKVELPEEVTGAEQPAEAINPEQSIHQFIALRRVLLQVLTDYDEDSLPWLFHAMLRNGRAIRDHLGDDAWRTLNNLRQYVNGLTQVQGANAGYRALEDIITLQAAFFGFCNETMPHHYGWRFMDIGRTSERCIACLELLKLAIISAQRPGTDLWETVLATTDNLTVYRRRYRSQLHPAAILDLLLFDESNPRSVGYMLKRLETQIQHLPHPDTHPFRSQEARLIIQASSQLLLVDLDTLNNLASSKKAQAALKDLLDQLLEPLYALSDAISHSHFSHAEIPKQLVTLQGARS